MAGSDAFDTHSYVKKLRLAGLSEEQAETHAEALSNIIQDRLATKQDMRELELRIAAELAPLTWGMAVVVGGIIAILPKIYLPLH